MKFISDVEDFSLESVCIRSKRRRKKFVRFVCILIRKISVGVFLGFIFGDFLVFVGFLERVRR